MNVFFSHIYTWYMVHVILRHLLYFYFVTRKASPDTLLAMLLETILNDLLLYILFTNLWMFYLLLTSFYMFSYVCIQLCWYIYIYIYICKFTSKCHSQTTPSLEWRSPGPENVFSTLCWQANPQLWERMFKPPSLPINPKVKRIEPYQDEMVSHIYKFTSKCHSKTYPW